MEHENVDLCQQASERTNERTNPGTKETQAMPAQPPAKGIVLHIHANMLCHPKHTAVMPGPNAQVVLR